MQSKRKKKYWRMIGWLERKVEKGSLESDGPLSNRDEFPEIVPSLVMFVASGLRGSGRGGEREALPPPVAFSIRAHVK